MKKEKRPIVFIVCTGLGRINRGYESFTRECFDVLKDTDKFDLYLIKGGGKKTNKEIVLFNLHRNGVAARIVSKLIKKNPYVIEQWSFCAFLIPLIIKKNPSVIYYSDFATGSLLWHIRRFLKFKSRLLLANGAPIGPPFKTEDHVQQLLPVYYSIGIKSDGIASKYTLLPYGFNINTTERESRINDKERIRK